MIADRRVRPLGTSRRIRALRWLAPDESPRPDKTSVGRRHYSHNREADDNPHGVWTLTKLHPEEQTLFQGWRDRVAA